MVATAATTQSKDPERMAKSRRAVVTPPLGDETNRPAGCEESTLDREELMTPLSAETFGQKDFDRESIEKQQRASEPVIERLLERERFKK